jgi:hypothetical protein
MENEVGGQYDQIEADSKKNRRRQDFPELFEYEREVTRLGHERIPKHPRQDVARATRVYQPNPKSLETFSWTPVRLHKGLKINGPDER